MNELTDKQLKTLLDTLQPLDTWPDYNINQISELFMKRDTAARELVTIGSSQIIRGLIEVIEGFYQLDFDEFDDLEYEFEAIHGIFGGIGARAIPTLLEIIAENHPLRTRIALDMLRHTESANNPLVTDAALAAYLSSDTNVRYSAFQTLAHIGDQRAVPILIDALKEPRWTDIWTISQGLGRLRDKRAIPALANLLYSGTHQGMVDYIVNALEYIDPIDGRSVVEEWIASKAGQEYIDQMAAAKLDAFHYNNMQWARPELPTFDPMPQYYLIQYDISVRALIKGLHTPDLSERCAHLLSAIDSSEARTSLEEWRNQNKGTST